MGVSPAITKGLQGLGPYRIDKLLGYNGMFASFRGVDLKTHHPSLLVAVHQSYIPDPAAWQSHVKTLESIGSTDPGPQICAPLKNGTDASHYWTSYIWLEGSHVGERIRDTGLPPPEEAFRWISEAARGLAFLHRRDIRHQIINPASIFLEKRGQVRLLHSGWGSVIRGSKDGLLNHAFSCILPFAAPEIASGELGDESSDVYALGSNLYYLLTGNPPFWDDDPATLVKLIVNTEVPLGGMKSSLPREAFDVLDEMLHKAPEDRPVNIPALADRLAIAAKAIEQKVAIDNEARSRTSNAINQQSGTASRTAPKPTPEPRPVVTPPERMPSAGLAKELEARELPPVGPDAYAVLSAPTPAPIPEPALEPKKASMVPLFILGGVVAALLVLAVGIYAVMSLMHKSKETAKVEEVASRKAINASYDMYVLTASRLRVLGQLSMGYYKQNGNWPAEPKNLLPLGAKQDELVDAWKHSFDTRPGGFIVSSGADGKWDNADDIWWDAEKGKQDGFMPPKPALAKPSTGN